ncbi:GNAT family N-acetyltransferase [Embleya sp. NPDC020630]|uniref:GNAT family N-acetyltransferase n=1 Tax=Embleya sp. NPDC020630 TaxID=3363979 RepID=UPI0037B3BF16
MAPVARVALADTVRLRPWRSDDVDELGRVAAYFTPNALAARFGAASTTIPDWYRTHIIEARAHGRWNACVAHSGDHIVGWAEYGLDDEPGHADIAALVGDRYQGHGLGTRLIGQVASVAKAAGVRVLHAQIRVDNRAARKALYAAFPNLRYTELQDGQWHFAVDLAHPVDPPRASNEPAPIGPAQRPPSSPRT